MARVKAIKAPNNVGVTLDAHAIQGATKMLGIDVPVRVKWGYYDVRDEIAVDPNNVAGFHRMFTDRNEHVVVLNPDFPDRVLNHTLWHELTHAHQRERDGNDEAERLYTIAHETVGYANNPYEVQAERVADKFHRTHPLTKKGS